MNELWALLWSKKGNGLHIEPLERTAQSGRRFFAENMTNDYLLVAYGTEEHVFAKADELRRVCIGRNREAA